MLNRIHSPLGLMAPAKKEPPPATADGTPAEGATPDSFAVEAARNVTGDIPAKAEGISEDEIREKVRAGLTRKQAITVIEIQRAEDAEKAKAKKAA